eukprot:TRINITY_DN3256_c0_g2_i4.p1 TRINITY_DN3256_c0_g2~~TRINITY_DN3256_c0_g2_i4.p1  ORF type:complete len:160 (-),score=35.57 TRINITY_DN3256_c0_g2_i4:159-638(-)
MASHSSSHGHEQGWSTVDALYFSAVSLTTVGYGDLKMENSSSRVFSIFYVLLGTLMTAFFLGTIAETFVSSREQLITMLYDSGCNQRLWNSNQTQVSEAEYLEHMLVESGRVDQETMDEIKHRWVQLHKSGIVTRYKTNSNQTQPKLHGSTTANAADKV